MMTTIEPPSHLSTDIDVFESIYTQAEGDRARVPWDDGQPSPALINWLNAIAPSIVRCGARVVVPGCGLGDDAVGLLHRGYEVTAFDLSPTAIEWARRDDPLNERCYHVADLFETPSRWKHRFDLVVEINTIQSLPPSMRESTLGALKELMSPHGHLLVICRGLDETEECPEGPPWPLRESELLKAASLAGLAAQGDITNFIDDSGPAPVRRLRGLFRRA
ncbi:MAG: methyltransferase domain-containing protein [Planctomycetota bacterium]|nr:methyltransferase domain-containing protein [Planctomycetota bacterium]